MTTAAELFALQETDLAIDGAVARLTEVEAELGETEELIEARQRVDQCRERVRPLEERQKGLDWEAEEVRGKAAAIENKLYGGTVRNPKELEDFQADLTSLRGQLSRREDALLEVMLELEDAEAGLRQAEATLAEVEESWKAQQTSLQETQATLKEEIEGLEAKRTRQVDGMDAAALSLYQALRERRQGTAVAVVERGLCQGCRISLPMSVVQKARAGAGLVQCVSCERILLVS
jgi:predicted  nucleic acid-binding Zn-ribbon protein